MEGIQTAPACGCRTDGYSPPVRLQGEATQLSYLNLTADESTDLNILTREGDKVTLSSEVHLEATRLTYAHLAYDRSGFAAEKGELVDFREERNTALSVEGSLSEQELADIEALLKDLGEMLKAALSGAEPADGEDGQDALALDRYGSLAAFEADYSFSTEIETLAVENEQLALETATTPAAAAPAVAAAAAAPVQAVSAPQPPATAVPAVEPEPAKTAAAPQAERTDRRMAQRVEDTGIEPRRFMRRLRQFLRGLMREMQASQTIDDAQAERGGRLLERFFSRIESPSAVAEPKAGESVSISIKTQQVSLRSYAYDFKAAVKLGPVLEETA